MLLIGRELRVNCNQKHYSDLGSDTGRRQYEISAVIAKRQFAEEPVVVSPNFGCFLKRPLRLLSQIKILATEAKEKFSTYTGFHNTRQLGLTTMHKTQLYFKVSKSVG